MNKRMRVIVIASLALNVLLIGVGGGMAYREWADHPWQRMSEELSPETRHIFGRTFQAAYRDIRVLGDEARKERAEMIKILSAETFDEKAFDVSAAKLVEIKGQMRQKKIEATKKLAQELPLEERRKMAERMARMVGGGHERHVKRHRRPMAMDGGDYAKGGSEGGQVGVEPEGAGAPPGAD